METRVYSKHLVSTGGTFECWGNLNDQSNAFRAYHDLPNVDVLDVHEYAKQEVSSLSQCISMALDVSRSLNKPLIIGEFNSEHTVYRDVSQRSRILESMMRAYGQTSIQGYLIWQYNGKSNGAQGGPYDLFHDDPFLQTFSKYATL